MTDDVRKSSALRVDGAPCDGRRGHGPGRSRGGSKDAFWADITPYSGSDHWIYQEGGFGPSIYLRDHPDIYIHTTGDLADNIEPTKIKRSAFIAAASGYYLATMPDRGESLVALSYANAHQRLAEDGRRAVAMAQDRTHARDAAVIMSQGVLREQRRLQSMTRFLPVDSFLLARLKAGLAETGEAMLASSAGWPIAGTRGASSPTPRAGAQCPVGAAGSGRRLPREGRRGIRRDRDSRRAGQRRRDYEISNSFFSSMMANTDAAAPNPIPCTSLR